MIGFRYLFCDTMNAVIRKNDFHAIVVIVVFYAVIEMAGITCPILFLTGISCAGCGMSRAWLSLLKLDVAAAIAYHPLFWLPVPVGLVLLFRKRLPRTLVRWTLIVAVILFLGVYAIRLLQSDNSVVTFAPRQGLVYSLLSKLWQ